MREVKVRIGTGALTRDLVWCECGRGLSLRGVWFFCPTCGRKIDQRSYREAIEEAVNNGAKPFVDGDDAALLQRAEKSEAACAEMQSTLRTSLKIPKAWMRGHITFEQWDAACQKVFDAIDKPICTNALEARLREARLEEAEWWFEKTKYSKRCGCEEIFGLCVWHERLAALKGAK